MTIIPSEGFVITEESNIQGKNVPFVANPKEARGNEGMADEFEKIAEETISKAQSVKCPLQDYVKGLRLIVEMLQEELTMSESEGG